MIPSVKLLQNQNSPHTSKMAGYAFTNNWFDKHVQVWSTLLESFHPSKILEVGCYEGKSTTFLIEKIANQRDLEIHCIDTWEGGIEHIDNEKYDVNHSDIGGMSSVENRFFSNVDEAISTASKKVKLVVHKGLSSLELPKLIANGKKEYFDMVYVDGSHQADDVLMDAVMAYHLTANDGLIIFDDYTWRESLSGGVDILRCPKIAVDAFTNIFSRNLYVVEQAPLYQFMVQKKI